MQYLHYLLQRSYCRIDKGILDRNMKFVSLFVLICLKTSVLNGAGLSRISVRDEWLVDSDGRIRIFHGLNSVLKGEPWFDRQILNNTRLQYYKKWGFTALRLGTMWSGIEPEEGRINQTYLDIISDIVDKAGEHGIHTILDMHQDVLSSVACPSCYDGIPKWLAHKFRPSRLEYPWPFKDIPGSRWFLGYLTLSVSSAFQQFYDNVGGSIDAFVRFWTNLARTFKTNTNVLGYELMNEPWAGNIYSDPKLLLPGEAVRKNLFPMYDVLFKEIAEVDKETLIFYEPVTWGVYLTGELTGTGFQQLPGGSDFKNRSVLSYHHYCWVLEVTSPSDEYEPLQRILCDDVIGSRVFPSVLESARRTGGSLFYTEFGLCEPDGNPNSINTVECNFVMSKTDEFLQSWTYWDSMFFDDNGNPKMNAVRGFSRPYATATAGTPVKMHFDVDEKVFLFDFVADDGISSPTEIFVPEVHYGRDVSCTTSPNAEWSFDAESQILRVRHKKGTPPEVSVEVRPK